MADINQALSAALGATRKNTKDLAQIKELVEELKSYMTSVGQTPKFIEQMPGARSPFFAVVEVVIDADSTSRKEGTDHIGADGPLVVTGVALFYKRTSGPYQVWGPATAYGAEIAQGNAQFGLENIFNAPHIGSFTVELSCSGSDRLWQDKPVSSALYSPEAGGAYILPTSFLVAENSTLKVSVTPDVALDYAGKVQAVFLGYKIVKGPNYTP